MKGILFKPDMIQAMVEGRKTQTRRVIKLQPRRINNDFDGTWEWKEKEHYYDDLTLAFMLKEKSPYQVGEVVYVKEAWSDIYSAVHKNAKDVIYALDYPPAPKGWKWHSPMMMPEWAARYFIKITGVRAESLQEISLEDAKAEGMPLALPYSRGNHIEGARNLGRIGCYRVLWDSLNPKYPWEMNPWVWVYSFELEKV